MLNLHPLKIFKYPAFQDKNPAITTTTDKWIEFDYKNMPAG